MRKVIAVQFPVEAYNAMVRIVEVMHPGVRDALAVYLNSRTEIFEPDEPPPSEE